MHSKIATVLALVTVCVVLWIILWAFQRKLIYFPSPAPPSPAAIGLSGATDISFPTEDGLTLGGWFVRESAAPWFTVIVFNGNAGNRASRASLARSLTREGVAVLLFDYRGYGGNDGSPSEQGLAADARAARRYLSSRSDVDAARIAYFGESLGTAVAVGLAASDLPAALILRSPFASLAEVGQFHYPWVPVRWLLQDQFRSRDVIGRVRCPLLVIAGDRDRIVPFSQSQRLFEVAGQPKNFVVITGADHNDAILFDGPEMIRAVVSHLRRLSNRN